jgi:predicted nucleotidyltransferase
MALNRQPTERLAPHEYQAVMAFLERLNAYYPDRVIQAFLFGSKARGDSRPDSDIDILLIVDGDDWQFQHAISDVASDVSLEYGVLIGPRVIGKARWEEMARDGFSLYENLAREGILLTPEAA